ncbi:LAQU0S17e02784g1_1 [Lachancea quebecensis]|uniref:LAQU0S17e02784g1_1 n=1 Tax=Lachancea quebecensis TaxID=1654605 RepID=A0A0P1KWS7_9SACH|nr:LAQU0S17e02784g1_1 [Lachancea quebecensis]
MKYLIVHAHPEPQSLTSSLKDVVVKELESQGHEVRVSDLYAQKWKTSIDSNDFEQVSKNERLAIVQASQDAYTRGTLTEDVKKEQEKIFWADTVIFSFPLWWFSMPAILKGWFDRVYSCGLAYGVGEYNASHWGDRYGEGAFSGKRAMLLVTVGGSEVHYSARGISGPLEDILFPINHGMLFYPGFTVLPPIVLHNTISVTEQGFQNASNEIRQRLRNIYSIRPIPYRKQNYGDYLIPSLVLRDDIKSGSKGFSIHKNGMQE